MAALVKSKIITVVYWVGSIFLAVFGVAAFLTVGLLLWAWFSPGSLWGQVQNHILPATMKVGWERIDFKSEHPKFGVMDFQFELDDLFVQMLRERDGGQALSLTGTEFRLQGQLQYARWPLFLHLTNLAVVVKDPIFYSADPEAPASPEQSWAELYQQIYSYLKLSKNQGLLDSVFVTLAGVDLHLASGEVFKVKESTLLRATPESPLQLETGIGFQTNTDGTLKVEMDPKLLDSDLPMIKANVVMKVAGTKLDSSLELIAKEELGQAALTGSFVFPDRKPKTAGVYTAKLALRPDELDLGGKLSLTEVPGPWGELKDIQFETKIPQTPGESFSSEASSFEVKAPLALFFLDKKMRPLVQDACKCKLPESLVLKVYGEAWLKNLIQSQETQDQNYLKHADVRAELESVDNPLFKVDLSAQLGIERNRDSYRFHPDVKGLAQVKSFQVLRKLLDSLHVLVPAPLDVLDGQVELNVDGAVSWAPEETMIPALLKVKLASAGNQSVDSEIGARIRLTEDFKKIHVLVNAKIAELFLQLPPLDPLGGMPRIGKDSRIQVQPPKKKPQKKQVLFTMEIEAATLKPQAIRLYSEFAKPFVPLSMRVALNTKGSLEGFVMIEPFVVSYLRRNVHIESLRLGLDPKNVAGKEAYPINGRLRVDQTEYKVFIDVAGTTVEPQIQMRSEPELSQSDVISVLLYDRISKDLDSGDADTPGSVQAAMADRAIGLFGLWAFASTPIRSFSYNPVTKTYTATVQVGDGLTAGIGTNWEQTTNLELRKRVSRQWVLTASWAPSEVSDTTQGSLVLQWENRF